MKICISVGHSILKNGATTSADGVVNEYFYNKQLAPFVVSTLKKEGHVVDLLICPEKTFTSKDEERKYKLNRINGKGYDLVAELHLNSADGKAKGTEVLYYSNKGKLYAEKIVSKLGTTFTNRGSKSRPELYMLNSTDCPAVIVESFFCDSSEDYKKASNLGFSEMARLISEGILNKNIDSNNSGSEINDKVNVAIVYSGDRDKAVATIMAEYIKGSAVLEVNSYKAGMAKEVFTIGGKATSDLSGSKDNVTSFNGKNLKETFELMYKYIKDKKY